MFKMLVDTCVWLDVAKDPRQAPVLGVVEALIKQNRLNLIGNSSVLRAVLDAAVSAVRPSHHRSGE